MFNVPMYRNTDNIAFGVSVLIVLESLITLLYRDNCTVLVIHPAHSDEVVLELSHTHLNIQRSFSSLVPLTAMFTATMNSCSHSFHQTEDINKQVQTLKSIPPLLSSSIIRKSWSTRNLLSLSGLIFFS